MFSKVSFEIHLERGGRWILESSQDEETRAIEMARRLLRQREDANAAKVIRQTTSLTGHKRENEVFSELRTNMKIALALTGSPETAPFCKKLEDFYELPARMATVRLLKMFLDKYQIVPLELLHSHNYLRKFEEEASLLNAAVFQVGTAQAKKLEIPAQQRLDEMTGFFKTMLENAKAFSDQRKSLPPLVVGNFEQSFNEIKTLDAGRARYHFFGLITHEFQTGAYSMREQKLDLVLTQFAQTKNAELKYWLDEWVADYLCFPEIIDSIIGQQFNFFEFLIRLIDITQGQPSRGKGKDSDLLVKLRAAIAENKLPLSRAVLLDRLIREIRSDKPLDKRDLEREEALAKELKEAVTLEGGAFLGGRQCEDAIAGRKLRERKRKLRAMGMDDLADNLG